MHFNPVTVLWVYIVLLVVGGMVGFLKAKSKMSLLMSLAFAAALSACQLGYLKTPNLADILLLFLLLFFVVRLLKGRKFMPAGLMTILTLLALVCRRIG
jgi:uncharacterized membrane protein (UPF0136 family)